MKNPPHPCEIIRDMCITLLGLMVTQAAKGLGVTRKTLSLLINGHAGISPEMAVRLSKAFGRAQKTGCDLQAQHDLAQGAARSKDIKVQRYWQPDDEAVYAGP